MVRIRVRPVLDIDEPELACSPCSPSSFTLPIPALSVKVRPASTLPSPGTQVKDPPNRVSGRKTACFSRDSPPLAHSYFSSDSESDSEDESLYTLSSSSASISSLGHLFHDEGLVAKELDMRVHFQKRDRHPCVQETIPLVPTPSGRSMLREVRLTCKICSKVVDHPMDSGCEDRERTCAANSLDSRLTCELVHPMSSQTNAHTATAGICLPGGIHRSATHTSASSMAVNSGCTVQPI